MRNVYCNNIIHQEPISAMTHSKVIGELSIIYLFSIVMSDQDDSIKCGVCSLPGLAVRTSTPVSVTTMVCSNWADNLPSWTIIRLSRFMLSDVTA